MVEHWDDLSDDEVLEEWFRRNNAAFGLQEDEGPLPESVRLRFDSHGQPLSAGQPVEQWWNK